MFLEGQQSNFYFGHKRDPCQLNTEEVFSRERIRRGAGGEMQALLKVMELKDIQE
jgi:hypothetical protein